MHSFIVLCIISEFCPVKTPEYYKKNIFKLTVFPEAALKLKEKILTENHT